MAKEVGKVLSNWNQIRIIEFVDDVENFGKDKKDFPEGAYVVKNENDCYMANGVFATQDEAELHAQMWH